MTTPKHICPDCGRPVYQSFVARGLGYVHADCEIARLTKQRDELLAAARAAIENMNAWNKAVESVIGRQPQTGIDLKPLIDAIAACEEAQ